MFFKKIFLFYLPRLDKYKIIRAKDQSYAVHILCRNYQYNPSLIKDFTIVKYDFIK